MALFFKYPSFKKCSLSIFLNFCLFIKTFLISQSLYEPPLKLPPQQLLFFSVDPNLFSLPNLCCILITYQCKDSLIARILLIFYLSLQCLCICFSFCLESFSFPSASQFFLQILPRLSSVCISCRKFFLSCSITPSVCIGFAVLLQNLVHNSVIAFSTSFCSEVYIYLILLRVPQSE